MLSALLVIVGNMLADVAVALADRRVRAGRTG
jgi:ABC-type dipeptide/oligopeptide/nickel transport system permease component